METTKGKELLAKLKDGTISPKERKLLESWYEHYVSKLEPIDDAGTFLKDMEILDGAFPFDGNTNKSTYKLWPRIAVAAAAVSAIVFGVYFFTGPKGGRHLEGSVATRDLLNDIAPGGNGATITLANGKVIELSGAKKGVVVGQEIKYDDGTALSGLQPLLPEGERSVALTASTARGQTYQFILPDGTKVWLNADSKLEFPSNFVNSKARNVKLSGEGYFEVSKDRKHPFIVESAGQEVEVLGTHFNVNSYANEESTRTTLLEGSVAVTALTPDPKKPGERAIIHQGTVLVPGQQSILLLRTHEGLGLSGSSRLQVREVDIEEAIAWKNGLFVFEGERLESIMKKIGRWYDVEVKYENAGVADETFSGTVTRFGTISIVLKRLELTGNVKFKVEGKTVKVSK